MFEFSRFTAMFQELLMHWTYINTLSHP